MIGESGTDEYLVLLAIVFGAILQYQKAECTRWRETKRVVPSRRFVIAPINFARVLSLAS
jgi:hypothetical protein